MNFIALRRDPEGDLEILHANRRVEEIRPLHRVHAVERRQRHDHQGLGQCCIEPPTLHTTLAETVSRHFVTGTVDTDIETAHAPDLGVRKQVVDARVERSRQDNVVEVGSHHELPPRMTQTVIERVAHPSVSLAVELETVTLAEHGETLIGVVRGSVIHHDQLEIGIALRVDAGNRLVQILRDIETGANDGNERSHFFLPALAPGLGTNR